ncbi:MAG TPA: hypothetical protein VNT99_19600, partial [Methylomirabilota bacterium]|nr:hypothetical protein [Methylomirabilota bacterium]
MTTIASRTRVAAIEPRIVLVPRPDGGATIALLLGLLLTWLIAGGNTPSGFMRSVAIGTGLSLIASVLIEVRKGSLTALLRADLVALGALYYLIFLEFLFPQAAFDEMISTKEFLNRGILCSLCAFAAIAVGRHFVRSRSTHWSLVERGAPPGILLILFSISAFCGYFHMLLAVDFDPLEMVRFFLEPRFDAPWQRGQYGDAKALLSEVGSMIYLIPPLAGVILGRRNLYSVFGRVLVFAVLLFTLFYGFCTGTRNVIGAYLLAFLVAYFYATGASWRNSLIPALLAVALMGASTYFGPNFRNIGIKDYWSGRTNSDEQSSQERFFVDYNFYVLSVLTHLFPDSFDYVEGKAPLWLLVRPVPRALWPDKPDGSDV